MTLADYIFFGMFGAFCLVDFIYSARAYPEMRFWRLRGLISFTVYVAVVTYAPLLWDRLLDEHKLLDISGMPFMPQFLIGLFVAQLVGYIWHRSMHANDFLWRHLHQMHHSAERMDIWGAFYFHPLDAAGFALMGGVALVFMLGASVEVVIAVSLLGAFLDMFTHANLKTPQWLGYLIMRPEGHAVHHLRGRHRHNYATLPLVDMMFGTFRNPKSVPAEAGFYDGASERIFDLLIGRDVSTPSRGERLRAPAE